MWSSKMGRTTRHERRRRARPRPPFGEAPCKKDVHERRVFEEVPAHWLLQAELETDGLAQFTARADRDSCWEPVRQDDGWRCADDVRRHWLVPGVEHRSKASN